MSQEKPRNPIQQSFFDPPAAKAVHRKFISTFRVALVRDKSVSFEQRRLANSAQAQPVIRKLIEKHGQSDREQFCVLMLNAKNEIIGLNIVSTGTVSSAQVCPREVLKAAILANSAALILAHNHPSGDVSPSSEDMTLTGTIVQAASFIGIQVHEHLIISMFDDRYYSFADHGLIKKFYNQIG